MSTVPRILRADHIGLMVPDMDQAVAWYGDKLGFAVVDRWADDAIGMEWAHLEVAGTRLELVKRPGLASAVPSTSGFHHLALVVDDCAASVAALHESGVEVIFAPSHFERHDMDWAFVADHLGNVIEIISYRLRASE